MTKIETNFIIFSLWRFSLFVVKQTVFGFHKIVEHLSLTLSSSPQLIVTFKLKPITSNTYLSKCSLLCQHFNSEIKSYHFYWWSNLLNETHMHTFIYLESNFILFIWLALQRNTCHYGSDLTCPSTIKYSAQVTFITLVSKTNLSLSIYNNN